MDLSILKTNLNNYLEQKNFKLYDVVLEEVDSMTFLTVMIENLDLKEIVNLNSGINEIVDRDFDKYYKENYYLEITSAGINRELRTFEHEKTSISNEDEVLVITKNNKQNCGILVESTEEYIILANKNEDIQIDRKKIVSININK